MQAMWLMLQQDTPDDYVIATGRAASVAEFCRLAFEAADLAMDDYVGTDPACCAPPRSRCCRAIRPRRHGNWVGGRA